MCGVYEQDTVGKGLEMFAQNLDKAKLTSGAAKTDEIMKSESIICSASEATGSNLLHISH